MIEDRSFVLDAYIASFHQLGQKLEGFDTEQFLHWFDTAPKSELDSIEAIILGECSETVQFARLVSMRTEIPLLALVEGTRLETILDIFEAGADDIIRKPVNVREILCRVHVVQRRASGVRPDPAPASVQVFFNGRAPIVGGEPLELPRRERRVLEYFVANAGKRIAKEQIFNAVYGVFEEDVCAAVIESHISKLRRKLKERLGFDPIDSKRYLGYCFQMNVGMRPFSSVDEANDDLTRILA